MTRTLALLATTFVASVVPAACQEPESHPPSALSSLHAQGRAFEGFLRTAERRRDTWEENWARATVPPEILERGRAVPGMWRLLVVAEDWCGDSANTVPYVARLGEALGNLEVRVVDSRTGRAVMEAHPTPDGRAATPTMVLLDEDGREAGCLVEQPQPLQRWWLGEARTEFPDLDERLERKYAWYHRDAGLSTMDEVVAMMEGAAADVPVCRIPESPVRER